MARSASSKGNSLLARAQHVSDLGHALLWVLLTIAQIALVIVLVAVLVRAYRSNALIVESFRVPPSFQAKGLSGEVVAAQVLDRLADMQAKSESSRAASSYSNNWGDELKIEIPNTGATVDQLWRLLRGWLGKETRISGEVIETNGGIALTARVGTIPGQQFRGDEKDLDALVGQAAELIYEQTQPYRYTVYLAKSGRPNERFRLLQQLTSDPSPRERKWAYNGLSVDLRARNDPRGSIAMAKHALAIDPNMLPALANLGSAHSLLGHQQAMVDYFTRMAAAPVSAEYDTKFVVDTRCAEKAATGIASSNSGLVEDAAKCLEASHTSLRDYAAQDHVHAALLRHDYRPALGFVQPTSIGLTPESVAAQTLQFRLRGELERGSSPALQAALDAYRAVATRGGAPETYEQLTSDRPLEAEALIKLGHSAEAAKLINATAPDCYRCLIARGLVAKRTGDLPAAQHWFHEAASQAPRLAPAFLEWGRLLLEARHFNSAEIKLKEATRLAPNWADPLKYRGDLLAAQGQPGKALATYNAALKLAPSWQELRDARAELLRGTKPKASAEEGYR